MFIKTDRKCLEENSSVNQMKICEVRKANWKINIVLSSFIADVVRIERVHHGMHGSTLPVSFNNIIGNLFSEYGWMICDFTSFSTVYQSYQEDGRLI